MNRYAKAVVGALVAALSAYQAAQIDNTITTQEWVTIAVAFLTGLGLVWGVPNTDAKGDVTPDDAPEETDGALTVPGDAPE